MSYFTYNRENLITQVFVNVNLSVTYLSTNKYLVFDVKQANDIASVADTIVGRRTGVGVQGRGTQQWMKWLYDEKT